MGPGVRRDDKLKRYTPPRSRGAFRPSFAIRSRPLKIRGRREDRVRAAPAVSCASAQESAHMSIQVQRRASGLPCAMALRLIRDLPGEPSSVATVTSQRTSLQSFAPASGARTTRFRRTLEPHASGAALTSTASCSTSVTIASAPLSEQDGRDVG